MCFLFFPFFNFYVEPFIGTAFGRNWICNCSLESFFLFFFFIPMTFHEVHNHCSIFNQISTNRRAYIQIMSIINSKKNYGSYLPYVQNIRATMIAIEKTGVCVNEWFFFLKTQILSVRILNGNKRSKRRRKKRYL